MRSMIWWPRRRNSSGVISVLLFNIARRTKTSDARYAGILPRAARRCPPARLFFRAGVPHPNPNRQTEFGVLNSWLRELAHNDPKLIHSGPPQHSPTERFQLLRPAHRSTARRISSGNQRAAAVHGVPTRPRQGTADAWRQTSAAGLRAGDPLSPAWPPLRAVHWCGWRGSDPHPANRPPAWAGHLRTARTGAYLRAAPIWLPYALGHRTSDCSLPRGGHIFTCANLHWRYRCVRR